MELIRFLEQLPKLSLTRYSYICFSHTQGDIPITLTMLKDNIRTTHALVIDSLDGETVSYDQMISTLEMSFLGMQRVYWLRNIPITTKEGKSLLKYIKNYTGPHCLIYATTSENVPSHDNGIVIDLPEALTKQQFIALLEFNSPGTTRKSGSIITEVFSRSSTLPLENCSILIRYVKLLGSSNQQDFIAFWLDGLITPTTSLFLLSGHFFAKDAKAFFSQWALIRDEYPEAFWVTFWSEQIWRAFQVVHFMQQKNMFEAKKISFRLPFSFMQRDWRNTTKQELQQAHQLLYSIDYNLKNGGDAGVFDVFFTSFMR